MVVLTLAAIGMFILGQDHGNDLPVISAGPPPTATPIPPTPTLPLTVLPAPTPAP